MTSGHYDPHLLFSTDRVHAYHIQHGQESPLTPSGSQTLSLLMVPTHSPFADLSTINSQNEAPEEDFYLHLHLPPELELPLPATTQIYHQPPRSYLIPRWDLGPDSGAFTRIAFSEKASQDDIDTFETILAQCTAFLERAQPPTNKAPSLDGSTVVGGSDARYKPYNPAEWSTGEKSKEAGQIVLIDEDDGSVVGELGQDARIVEDPKLKHGSKNPVEIELSQDGQRVDVRPASEDYLRMARHPAYKDSSLVQNAAAASRLIVTTSSSLGNMMASGADSFTQKTQPNPTPLNFSPATHERMRKLHSFTTSGASMSSKTVGSVTKYGQNMGAKLTRRGNPTDKSLGKDYKPGFLNKSMIAFSTIADGIAESGRSLLTQSGAAATTVVQHKYGPEAGSIAGQMAGGMKNVGLVYIDVTGVSRRAVVKSVAKGMVVGRVKGGGDVLVGGGDGGTVPEADIQRMATAKSEKSGVRNTDLHQGEPHVAGFGTWGQQPVPPGYESSLGEPIGADSERARPPKV